MSRVKGGATSHARHRKVVNAAKGHYGARSRNFRTAKQSVEKAMQYAYTHRKQKKRAFRRLWIARINAASRMHGVSYSKLMHQLKEKDIQLNRKVLADLAMNHPETFEAVVKHAQ